jgi:DNA invertase Pin-like site-specific DNA recombinase
MAKQRGYEVVREYVDTISGAKSKRPGLDQLMADARRNRFDIVLVAAFDRMARSVRHFLEVLDELTTWESNSSACAKISTPAVRWEGLLSLSLARLRSWSGI